MAGAELLPRYAEARVGAPRPGGAKERFQDFLSLIRFAHPGLKSRA